MHVAKQFIAIVVVSVALVGVPSWGLHAQVPASENNDDTARWLAVAFIAEAGWLAEKDHRGIFHVMRKRWPKLRKRFPKQYPRFVDVIHEYVAAFDSRTKRARTRWLLSLHGRPQHEAPAGWPSNVSWPRHLRYWRAAVRRAHNCLDGIACRDPYPRSLHWGGDMDKPQGCMVKLDNVGTDNTFYRVDLDCKRSSLRRVP